MTAFGYDRRLSAGCIAASGTLASLIPPSIIMVIYAILTEQSVALLLMAGLVPGLLSAAMYMGGIYTIAKVRPDMAPQSKIAINWSERISSLKGVWGIGFLFLLVIGGIYTGFFVPTYAGAVGAFGAFLIVVTKRRLTKATTLNTFKDAGVTTSVIFIIVIGGIIFARYLTYTGIIADVSQFLLSLELNKYTYLFAFAVIYLILGMLIDPIAIMVITLPVMYPILIGVGFDPIWLGVIAIKLAEISLITPPVGLNLYIIKGITPDVSLSKILRGSIPFMFMMVLAIIILCIFPEIVTWLPDKLMGKPLGY